MGFSPGMAISLGSAMGKLAEMQRTAERAKKRAMAEKETAEEQAEYLYHSGVRFASAAAAGAADAMVDDTLAGLTPAEMLGLGAGVLSLTGVLGAGTKTARSAAEGALCYAIGSRSNAFFGGNGQPAAELPPADEGGAVAGAISASEEDALLAAMREEDASGFRQAEALID